MTTILEVLSKLVNWLGEPICTVFDMMNEYKVFWFLTKATPALTSVYNVRAWRSDINPQLWMRILCTTICSCDDHDPGASSSGKVQLLVY